MYLDVERQLLRGLASEADDGYRPAWIVNVFQADVQPLHHHVVLIFYDEPLQELRDPDAL